MTVDDSPRRATLRVERLVEWITGFYLASLVFSGALRYYLNNIGLYPLSYLPKFLLLLCLPLFLATRWRASKGFFIGSVILGIYLVWGAVNLPSPAQALFGLWVLTPLLWGLLVSRYIIENPTTYRRLVAWLFFIVATGVLLNPLLHYPWIGTTTHFGGKTLEASRHWSYLGLNRYGGFSRASFNAASQLLVFAIWLVVTLRGQWKPLIVWLIAGIGITLTTSKGPLGVYILLTTYFLSAWLLRHGRLWRQLWTIALWSIASVLIILPLSTLFIHYAPTFKSPLAHFVFASLGERLNSMWPHSLALLGGDWHWLVGRGLGGIGAAQQRFEPTYYLPGDNLFVSMTVVAGIGASAAFLIIFVAKVHKLANRTASGTLVLPFALLVLTYGIVSTDYQIPLLALVLGISISLVMKKGDGRLLLYPI